MKLFKICLGASVGRARDAEPPGSSTAGCTVTAELGALGKLELHGCWEGSRLGRVLG